MPRPVVGAGETAEEENQAALKGTGVWSLTWVTCKTEWADRTTIKGIMSWAAEELRGGRQNFVLAGCEPVGRVFEGQRLWDLEASVPCSCLLPSSFPLRARNQDLPMKQIPLFPFYREENKGSAERWVTLEPHPRKVPRSRA